MKYAILLYLNIIIFFIGSAQAELHLVVNQSATKALPIVVMPFGGQLNIPNQSNNITAIITNDLKHSGDFTIFPSKQITNPILSPEKIAYEDWLHQGYDYMIIGSVKPTSQNTMKVSFSLVNLVLGQNQQNPIVISHEYQVPTTQLRAVAHAISNAVYQELTGIRGIFATRIAYILVKRPPNRLPQYFLEVADADGYNPQVLVQSNEPLMSPSWSPNGKNIAYVSLARDKASIYIVNVASGQEQLVSSFPGINGAPAWSPNGKKLAIVLSKTGHPKIYIYHLNTNQLKQITFGDAIDTEPCFAPNGKSIIFTSNRNGGPQIYRLRFASGKISRLTFEGNYNARASFTPNGKNLILLHQNQQGFNIAKLNLATGVMRILTHNGYDSTPSLAPNGQMVIYANNASINDVLEMMSITNGNHYIFPVANGESVLEPAWSPFLS